MKKRLFTAILSSAIVLTSCGGGGGSSTTDNIPTNESNNQSNTSVIGSLSGVFVDAPVAGLEFETTSGVKGITDEEGKFTYNKGDEITFKIGNLILGKTKGADVVTPASLLSSLSNNEVEFAQKLQEMVALLLSLDDDNTDNIIRINDYVRQKFKEVQQVMEFLNTDLQNLEIDIDGDNQSENLYNLVQGKLEKAKIHFAKSMIAKIINFFTEYAQENNTVCSASTDYQSQLLMSCQDGFRANFYVDNGVLKIEYPSEGGYIVSKMDDGEICIYKNNTEDCSVISHFKPSTPSNNNNLDNNQQNNSSNFDHTQVLTVYENMKNWEKDVSIWEMKPDGFATFTKANCQITNLIVGFNSSDYKVSCNGVKYVLTGYDQNTNQFYLHIWNENTNLFEEKTVIGISRITNDETNQIAEVCLKLDNSNEFCIETQ